MTNTREFRTRPFEQMITTWKKNGLRLRVLDSFKGRNGEQRLLVCKETATTPAMALFSVRADDVR